MQKGLHCATPTAVGFWVSCAQVGTIIESHCSPCSRIPFPHVASALCWLPVPLSAEQAIAAATRGASLASLNIHAICERSYARVQRAAPVISQATQSSRHKAKGLAGFDGRFRDDIDLQR